MTTPALFPPITPQYILAFQFSSWYPKFASSGSLLKSTTESAISSIGSNNSPVVRSDGSLTIRSTIIRPLSAAFHAYLEDGDGVWVPEGSEGAERDPHEGDSSSDDDEDSLSDSDEDDTRTSKHSRNPKQKRKRFAFPELDAQIRSTIAQYGAVFPKLNFSSPKDASWVLPPSSPLKCTSPADVYLLLKSSDFVSHDLSVASVFAGCENVLTGSQSEHTKNASVDDAQDKLMNHTSTEGADRASTNAASVDATKPEYELELVLRKWYPIDRGREFRCFVRDGVFIALSQRDTNYYEYMSDPTTQDTIRGTARRFWEERVRERWEAGAGIRDYTFDLFLTRDLARAHVIDFNPYALRTDALLWTWEELAELAASAPTGADTRWPELRVVTSPTYSATPDYQHNMVPLEALSLSAGRGVGEFADVLGEEVRRAMAEDSD
ncbi:cytoplasmic protein [Hygrophoropsis aurantiaca]|uniref:Cytoplasmic protein n=1 Tax=Hygrophoropsis aurantiaca TaxID=72124 RepID=A0ACB8A0I2_9AGAM|nr:cytoplasmic protein [Hygrophoropsis aurantiaca]